MMIRFGDRAPSPSAQEILRFAQDFACRLPLRSRLQNGLKLRVGMFLSANTRIGQ